MAVSKLTAARATRHEALYLRLQALHTQVAALAKTRPGEAALPLLAGVAEELLFACSEFRAPGQRRGLVGAAPHLGGLAAQLGQAVAVLEGYEAAHTGWIEKRQHVVWLLGDGTQLPVQRLHPQAPPPSLAAVEGENMPQLRAKLARRIDRHIEGKVHEQLRQRGIDPYAPRVEPAAEAEETWSYPRRFGRD